MQKRQRPVTSGGESRHGGNSKWKGNRHIVTKEEPTSNLLLAITQSSGAQIEKVGASTGRVEL
jgi:hypothetical protein